MEENETGEIEAFRKSITDRIALESDRLVQELFSIIYDPETESKVKLSAITILLDRALPKMGVKHSKEDETEERGSRVQLRQEIEALMLRGNNEE